MGKHIMIFQELKHGYELALNNAKLLCEEANVLVDIEHYARAYTLNQLAIEEIGKCIILLQAILANFMGQKVDMKWLKNWGYENHIYKNRSSLGAERIILMYFQNVEGLDCSKLLKDLEQSADEAQLKKSNKLKNDSLYVGFNGNKFVSPQEVITKKMVDDISMSARMRIAAMGPMLQSEEKMKEVANLLFLNTGTTIVNNKNNIDNMLEKQMISVNKYTKILVPASSYEMLEDPRLLIPFTSGGGKIGFVDNKGKILVKPKYAMYYGECYDDNELIKVTIDYLYGFSRKNGKVACYSRPLFGVIDARGETVLNTEYFSLGIASNSIFSVQRMDGKYGVIDRNGTEIVPYGKYSWIDFFDKGLARVKYGKCSSLNFKGDKWGIIDKMGKEVLPVKYDNIWSFYEEKYDKIVVEKDGVKTRIPFCELK